MPTMEFRSSGRRADVDPATTVLVFDSPFVPPAGEACPALCRSASEGSAVLSVHLTGSAVRQLHALRRAADGRADRVKIVSVDPGSTPTTAAESSDVVERVGSPSDLTALGVEITKVLSAWEGEDADVAVCFDSVTPLLQYVDLHRAVRFLQALTNWFDDVGASAHVHVDPDAHDGQTVATLTPLFDDVVERDESSTGRDAD